MSDDKRWDCRRMPADHGTMPEAGRSETDNASAGLIDEP